MSSSSSSSSSNTPSAPTLGDAWQAQLGALEPNWDTYDAPKISPLAIATLERFNVIPCSNGGITLETRQNGRDIEICIDEEGTIEMATISWVGK